MTRFLLVFGTVLLVFGAIGTFYLRPPATVEENAVSVPGQIDKGVSAASTVKKTAARVPAHVGEGPSAAKARLAALPQACTGNGCTLSVKIESDSRCFAGDYDFIAKDLERSAQPRLLLTIEPLGKSGDGVASRPLDLRQAVNGAALTLALPTIDRRTAMGIFLCKDSRNERRCRDKEAVDFNMARSEDAVGRAKNPKYQPHDRIYYFQPLIFDGRNVFVSSAKDDAELDMSVWKLRMEFLMATAGADESPSLMSDIMKATNLIYALHSLALAEKENTIQVRLTQFDPSCRRK